MLNFKNFTEAYVSLVKEVQQNFDYEASHRGQKIREKLAVSFSIENPRDRLPYIKSRNFSLSYLSAETLWYLSGNNSTEWISQYSGFWKNISDDGMTANSAYGARIFRRHPHHIHGVSMSGSPTQWEFVKNELRSDPDSRRAVIHIRTAQDSYLAKKDMPCTLALQFFIRGGKLHMWVTMRSSDLIFGIGNDIPAFTLIQEMMATELGVGLGTYYHTSGSLHIYERHFEMADNMISERIAAGSPVPSLPFSPDDNTINTMMSHEAALSSSKSIAQLASAIDSIGIFPTYWKDHLLLIASHHAARLGSPELQSNLIQSTNFSGYHNFRR